MFSFHKPKIYRSNLGCCICKAKSSSSRFTDSNKYENEFERCFRIQEKRSGEICNACVLLVKRWKKLSPENRLTKHWHHVVDARAGPGTKLTNIRRITSSSSAAAAGHHQNSSSSSSCVASSASQQQQQQHHDSRRHSKSDPLPLTSNQSANSGGQQASTSSPSSGGPRRSFGVVNRARAVDTNVSTFTFGETSRRSYMALESNFLNGASSSLNKPQSALSSSAFESVIKRFRQRQQQQQIEATRRQQNRLQKIKKRQQQAPGCTSAAQLTSPEAKRKLPIQLSAASAAEATRDAGDEDNKQQEEVVESFLPVDKQQRQQQQQRQKQLAPMKRVKRLSESIGSLTVDGIRITSLLDGAVWRKEKTCCGIIFRGLHNEVAVFPKLLRPCQCRSRRHFNSKQTTPVAGGSKKTKLHPETERAAPIDDPLGETSSPPPPPPRTTKSGSVSSCDSNTSGTGSMDCPQVDYAEGGGSKLQQRRRVLQRKSELRLRTSTTTTTTTSSISRDAVGGANRNPSAGAQKLNSPGLNSSSSSSEETQSSSGASMSHLMLMEDEEDGLVCELEMEQDFESSTDGSDTLVTTSESQQQQQQQEKSSAKKSSNSVVGAAF